MGGKPTYQELLAAYKKLLIENELLHKEVDRLQSLLSSKSTPLTRPAIKRHLSLGKKWMCSAISSKDVRMYSHGDPDFVTIKT